jgi:uroporphyrinogen decarboxylase
MTKRENLLRTIRFDTPESIPIKFCINAACWNHYDNNALFDLMESHSLLFPDFRRPSGKQQPKYQVNALADTPYIDPWQCVWETAEDGITGSVHQHPLESWDSFADYQAPDPLETDGTYPIDWEQLAVEVKASRDAGLFPQGGLPHGHTFLRLQDIRGYENFIFDMCDEDPNVFKLIEMVEEFNYGYISKWLELEPDMISYPEDLGMQVGPMLSPEQFRKYIKPSYQRLMKPARDKGVIVHMHSDGDIRSLVDDLIDGGVEIINLQDLVNGIDWIADKFSGKVCVDLDIDRQDITFSGTPAQIDALIREEVEKIGSKRGGLMLLYGLYPGVPLENATALMDAMERYSTFYS